MKTAWNIVAALAVANILAIGGLIGWLRATDRLNAERVRQVREVFVKTIGDDAQAKAVAEAAEDKAKTEQATAARAAPGAASATERIHADGVETERQVQEVMRKQKELELLKQSIASSIAALEEREKKLAADRASFSQERARVLQSEDSAQFKQALATLEAQKPKDAKQVLAALINTEGGAGRDQAVAYLSRLEEGKRGKVLAEFVKEDPGVAAELLERLRTRGLMGRPADAQTLTHDTKPAPLPAPDKP